MDDDDKDEIDIDDEDKNSVEDIARFHLIDSFVF